MLQFQDMSSFAFYVCLWIGEITAVSKRAANPSLHLHLTELLSQTGELAGFKVNFGNFKQRYNVCPFSVIISRQPRSCPVELFSGYLALRSTSPGAIFMSIDDLPVSRSTFSQQLLMACHLCDLDPSQYKGHSFRVGAASHAADRGFQRPKSALGSLEVKSFYEIHQGAQSHFLNLLLAVIFLLICLCCLVAASLRLAYSLQSATLNYLTGALLNHYTLIGWVSRVGLACMGGYSAWLA